MRNVGCLLLVLLTASAFGAIDIDVGRQLFVDDYLIETNTLVREWGRPVKYEHNPVLSPETEAELNEPYDSTARPNGGGMWWDAKKGVFRLWYEAGWLWSVAYAESKDGIRWMRPKLDIVPGTNLVLPLDGSAPHPDSWSVVPDAHGEGWWMFLRQPGGDEQGYLYWSDDGLHWQFKCRTGVCGDRSTFFHDPFRGHYVYSLRTADAKAGRSRAYRAAVDPVAGAKWAWAGFAETAEVKPWLCTDARDLPEKMGPAAGRRPQLYNFDAVAYESLMVGAFEIHYGPENDVCERAGLPKITDLQFAYSRDGFTYERPDRIAAIRSERWESEKWDRGYVQSLSNLMVIMGDELWLYYGAFRGDGKRLSRECADAPWAGVNSPRNGMYHKGAMGLAKLRRDGFAALKAATSGFVQTKEVVFSGSRLYVNAVADEVACEVLGARGEVLARRALMRVNATKALLGEVGEFASRPVRLRFTVTNGRLYSFWVSAYPNGESGGYLAGGGPGYATLRDVPPPPSAARLAADFAVPPRSARAYVNFDMMNGHITREGITKDLESLQQAGIGGLHLYDLSCGVPKGPVVFNSPEWRELMRHLAAEAKRLDLDLMLFNCSGWSASGGPWVAPSNGMKQVGATVARVAGSGKRRIHLPAADLGHGYCRDIATIAFPTPAAELEELPPLKERRVESERPRGVAIEFEAETEVEVNGVDYRPKVDYVWGQRVLKVAVWTREDAGEWQLRQEAETEFALHGAWDPSVRHLAFPETLRTKHLKLVFTLPPDIAPAAICEVKLTRELRVSDLKSKRLDFRFQRFAADRNAAAEAVVKPETVRVLSVKYAADGSCEWKVPKGDWTVVRLVMSANGAEVHPASDTGGGLEVDKLDAQALNAHFEAFTGELCRLFGWDRRAADAPRSANGVIVDSYEVGSQNWTERLPEEFARRRGYALTKFLPALAGYVVESGEATDRFFTDFRRTVSDLFAENYAGALAAKCHEYGLNLILQPYGNCPGDNMDFGRYTDVPMCEFWSVGQTRQTQAGNAAFVAGISRFWGKRICAAEAFTSAAGEGGRWQTTPYALKHQGDVAFAEGVNRLVFHRFVHQPWTDDRYQPGMTMGAWGMHFDRTQTWWKYVGEPLAAITRTQAMLQRGQPVMDILYFAGEEVPNECGNCDGGEQDAALQPPRGWKADIVTTSAIMALAVEDGKLVAPSGVKYELLALPKGPARVEAAENPQLKEKLAELVKAGAKLVFGTDVREALADSGCAPDAIVEHPGGVWTHREEAGTDWYFVATPNDEEQVVVCSFRQTGRVPEIWDAETGAIGEPMKWREEGGRTIVEVAMRPNGSAFVVFPERPTAKRGKLFAVAGAKRERAKVTGKIKLSFPQAGAVELDRFVDWTALKDFDQRHFSGTATYEFAVEGEGTLDLGEVKHFAEVSVDGGKSAVMWRPPFRVELKGEGVHRLVVKVTNLWPNRLIGDDYLEPNVVWENWTVKEIPDWVKEGRDSPTAAKTFTTRRHWIKTDPLLPSGILGPLTWREQN